MIVALYLFLAIVIVGVVLRIFHHPETEADNKNEAEQLSGESQCCGMHITCEADSLLASVSPEIVYYDDEELDAYKGIAPDGYSDADIERFRDVLLTLLPEDIAGWARSLQLRGIALPAPVRDELIMIVAEARKAKESRH